MSIIPDISLGRNSKRYIHNMSFDNNTTMPFGVVQPLMSQRLEANSKISVNMRQLVRLAPMPVPTFARLNMVNEVSFVPTVDVCPYYEALISQMSFSNGTKTFYPTQLPQTTNSFLLWLLLFRFDDVYFSVYNKSGVLLDNVSSVSTNVRNQMFSDFFGGSFTWNSFFGWIKQDFLLGNTSDVVVSIDGADYVHYVSDASGAADYTSLFCFRFGERARRFRSVLLGLGYSLNVTDISPVSLIPLLSYYKAWFDLYYPVRDLNWTDTNAYKLIKYIEDYTYLYNGTGDAYSSTTFFNFLLDCSNTFYVSKDDIVSVHRDKPNLVTSPAVPSNLVNADGNIGSLVGVSSGSQPTTSVNSLIVLQALQRFTRYFNKNSVIGKRISKFLQVHYGASVANSLYKDANHIGSFSYPLSVDDVMSTSDTFDVTGDTSKGEMLGSYAGKGIGFDKSHFEFTAPTFGYFFVLSSVSTPVGYFQGNSGDLYVTDFDSVPTPDYDALGFEVSPRGQFIGLNDCYFPQSSVGNTNPRLTAGFGFVPRYTGLKYHKNIVNGDISRRSTSSSLSAYHLNRIITPFTVEQTDLDTSKSPHVIKWDKHIAAVPSASTEWRYLSKENWLGDYNRIFYNRGYLYPHSIDDSASVFGLDDNFIVQTVFESKVTNQYKPLSQSWDTYEETTDDSSVDVRPE